MATIKLQRPAEEQAEHPADDAAQAARPRSSRETERLMHLRGLAHHLKPVVALGKEGITEPLVEACNVQLLAHELIKVKLMREAPLERHDAARELAEATGALLVAVIGRVLVLYRAHPKKPQIFPGKRRAEAEKGGKKRSKPQRRPRGPSARKRARTS